MRYAALVVLLFQAATGYLFFQDKIPNGRLVPHPCIEDELWAGVGHETMDGGTARNQFGLDFKANGFVWTEAMCNRDSDGDGRSNGVELGDPSCEWAEGAEPSTSEGISHPGVCEPWDATACADYNSFLACEATTFDCPAESEDGVELFSIMFPETEVPADDTTYRCALLDLPSDGDYHVVGYKPAIDNADVMHHMLVYGCDDDVDLPYEAGDCDMYATKCSKLLFFWGVGYPGNCYSEEYGLRVGTNGFKKAFMQVHWDNPRELSGMTDGSGLQLLITENRRQYDGGSWMVGTNDFAIPPRQPAWDEYSQCGSDCTSHIEPINLVSFMLHMHLIGIRQGIQHVRNETVLLEFEHPFVFDDPPQHVLEDHHQFLPGDKIKVHCQYNSSDRDTVTYNGDGTYEEMCLVFIMYYPLQEDFGTCLNINERYTLCERPDNGGEEGSLPNCDLAMSASDAMIQGVTEYLEPACGGGDWCPEECSEFIFNIKVYNPCYRDDRWPEMREIYLNDKGGDGMYLVMLMENCDEENRPTPPPPMVGAAGVCKATTTMATVSILAVLVNYVLNQ